MVKTVAKPKARVPKPGTPLYPKVVVRLSHLDDGKANVYGVLSRVNKALRRHGVPLAKRHEFFIAATGGSYDNVFRVANRWVNVR